jgi:hypothetical protein
LRVAGNIETSIGKSREEGTMSDIIMGVFFFLLGVGAAAVAFARVLARKLDRLHEDNLTAAATLHESDRTVTRKVEEQNMSAVSKRLDELET